jgi:hypothetical protein
LSSNSANGSEEELSDYRVVLSCMRKRLRECGMTLALQRLDELDRALQEAIAEGRMAPPPTIN